MPSEGIVDVLRPASETVAGIALDVAGTLAVAGAAAAAGVLVAAPGRPIPRPWLIAMGAGSTVEVAVLVLDGGGDPVRALTDPQSLAALARILLLVPMLTQASTGRVVRLAVAAALLATAVPAVGGPGKPLTLALAVLQAAALGWLGVLVVPDARPYRRRHWLVAIGLIAVAAPALVRVTATTAGGLTGAARDPVTQLLVGTGILLAAIVLLSDRVLRTAVAAAVLAAGAALTVVPLRSVPAAFTITLAEDVGSVVVTLAPAQVGANELHLYVYDRAGAAASIEAARAVLEPGGGDIPLTQIGSNHLLTYEARVPSEGRWRLALTIHTPTARLETATTIDVS